MRFNFKLFVQTLGCMGGILYLADVISFAYAGSNIDYNIAFLVSAVIGSVIGAIRRRT